MFNKNSWARRTLLKLGKRTAGRFPTKVGSHLFSKPIKSAELDRKVRGIMRNKKWGEGAIGRISHDAISKKLKDYYKNNDEKGATNYIKSQEEKMRNQ